MKKCLPLACLFLAVLLLCGCGGAPAASGSATASQAPASSGPYGSSADYKAVIEAARPAELNDLAMYGIVTSPNDPLYAQIFDTYELVADDYERYAVSAGTVITLSYGVFIILPKEGMHDTVMAQVEGFVEQQQKAMENYLQDQYEIAKAAIIKTAPTGEILLAMCPDAETVMSNMEAGLAA